MEKQYSYKKAYKLCAKKGLSFVRPNGSILTDNPPRLICPHPKDKTAKDWIVADVQCASFPYNEIIGFEIMPSYDDLRQALLTLRIFVEETGNLNEDTFKKDELSDALEILTDSIQKRKDVLNNRRCKLPNF